MFFKCLENKDSDIEKMNEANILSSVKNYLTCFEHAYWLLSQLDESLCEENQIIFN